MALAPVNIVGVHVAPAAGSVMVQVELLLITGEPASVMRMAEAALDNIAVDGVKVTVAVVIVPLIWEPRVILSLVKAP